MKRKILSFISLIICICTIIPFAGCIKKDESKAGIEFEAYCLPITENDIAVEDDVYYADSRILITAAATAAYAEIEALVQELGGEITGYISTTSDFQILFSTGKTYRELNDIAEKLLVDPIVEEASLSYIARIGTDSITYTNDPWSNADNPLDFSGLIWDEEGPKGNNWWAEAIGMPSVWDMDLELQPVKVGIIDSMFDTTNEDLDNGLFVKLWNNPEDSTGNCNVSKLYQDAIQELALAKQSGDRARIESAASRVSIVSHGTHVSGIIAAEADNGLGIAGISQNSQLYGYAMLSEEADASSDSHWGDIFMFKVALAKLLNEGVKVINISMGFNSALTGSQSGDPSWSAFTSAGSGALESFLFKYIQAGNEFLIMKSAGNDSTKGTKYDPAYDILGGITNEAVAKRIIVVGAAELRTGYYTVADFSNTGNRIDVYAPGVDVLSDIPANAAALKSGTSMAAPIVSGFASLIWGLSPDLSAEQVRQIIIASTSASIFALDGQSSIVRDWINYFEDPCAIVNAKICVDLAQSAAGAGGSARAGFGALNGIIYAPAADGQGFHDVELVSLTLYNENGEPVSDISVENIVYYYTDDSTGASSTSNLHSYTVLLEPGTYTLEAAAAGYAAKSLEVTIAADEVKELDFELMVLVTDAYQQNFSYTGYRYDEQTGQRTETQLTANFHIPQINLEGSDAERINKEIYDAWYPQIQQSASEIDEYGTPFTSDGMSYRWNINGDVLSLIASNNAFPDWSGGTEYLVYNVSISSGKQLSKDEVYSSAGLSRSELFDMARDVLGSAFFDGKDWYIQSCGYDDFFIMQLEKTISDENLEESIPYLDETGKPCIIARIYSLAAADYYWHDLNLEDFELNPDYKSYMELKEAAANGSSFVSSYKLALLQHPSSTAHSYTSDGSLKTYHYDTKYTLYDIDKNGIPELIVKEDLHKYYIYTFDGNGAKLCGNYDWLYGDCLYGYDGNGIVVYEGGMGSLRLEYISLYTLSDCTLEYHSAIASTEEYSYEELYSILKNYTSIDDFHLISDYTLLTD